MAFNMEDIVTASLDRPIWALSLEDASWLIPDKKTNCSSFAVMSFSAEKKGVPKEGQEKKEDDIGRTTRALPLYIAERINLETQCLAVNYNPVLKNSGPVLSTQRTSGASLHSVFKEKHTFIITGHFEKDYLNLRNKLTIYIYNMQTGEELPLTQITSIFESQSDMARKAANDFFIKLEKNSLCSFQAPPAQFSRPPKQFCREYMDGLGQLFMQTIVQNNYISKDSLWGEDRMLNWYLSLWKVMPNSVVPRLMYIRGVLASFEYGSNAYKPHLSKLSEYLISLTDPNDPINRISPLLFQKIGNQIDFEKKKNSFKTVDNKNYQSWLSEIPITITVTSR